MKLIKILNLLIIVLMLNFNALGQEVEVPLKNVSSFNLPKGAKKLSRSVVDSSDLINYKESKIRSNDKTSIYYSVDKTVLQLNGFKGKVPSNYLEQRMEYFDLLFSEYSGSYRSEYRVLNARKFLIIHYDSKHSKNGRIDFYGVNKLNDKTVSGAIYYRKAEKADVLKTLESILENIKI
ncbi:hypothetical protein [Pedobacter metabolipauper]|uniref:Uncharacterized protein n=1 Tax=Pedobacter metabolipauper TaxID=425513 RepID=A0A4R6SVW9_9SPHI|nr:hypothetical protein [Pedobacter metabolipauper]TDQ09223.1 hypothetical protein ATK78_1377 [Pedobacter metabolipauper]